MRQAITIPPRAMRAILQARYGKKVIPDDLAKSVRMLWLAVAALLVGGIVMQYRIMNLTDEVHMLRKKGKEHQIQVVPEGFYDSHPTPAMPIPDPDFIIPKPLEAQEMMF